MELAAALIWGVGSVAVAGVIDYVGLDWMQQQVSKSIRNKVHQQPLVFEPGDDLKVAKLD